MANIFSCCVPYCRSKSNETHLLSFHAFPEIGSGTVCVTDKFGAQILIDRREVWISTLKVKGLVTKSMRVCSLHFKESEFFTKAALSKKRVLKTTAVPSLRLPRPISRASKAKQIKNECERKFPLKNNATKASSLNGNQQKAIFLVRNIVYLKQKYTQDDFLQEDVKDPLVSDSAESDIKQGICSNVEESAREIEAVDLINIESILTSDVNLKQNDEKIQNDSYTKTSSFECKLCDYKCEEVYFLTLHLKQKHNPLDSENCEHCGKVFCYDPGIRSNADDNPCKFCSINTIELKQNVESNSNFLCDRCPFRCNITETMMQHLSDQHGIANPYLRLHCDKLFVESDDKLLRTEPKKFKCKFCSYKSVSRSGVNAHTATRHGIVCGPSTKKAKQPNLKSMILACSECPLVYVGKDALIRHMETTHWKRNSCHICEKVFPSKEVLDSHVEIHSSDELYRCLTCDYKCATKEFLRLHIENKHNMIVSVDECDNDKCMEDKKGNSKIKLQCNVCQFQCTDTSDLIHHLKAAHIQDYDSNKDQSCDKPEEVETARTQHDDHEAEETLPDKDKSRIETVLNDFTTNKKTFQIPRRTHGKDTFKAKLRTQMKQAMRISYQNIP